MEKRFFVAMILSLLIMLGYPYFLQKIYPAANKTNTSLPLTGERSADAVNKEIALQRDLPSAELIPSRSLSGEEKKFDYQDKTFQATFTNLGGGISSLSLKAFALGRERGNFLMDRTEGELPGLDVRVFENGAWEEGVYDLEAKEKNSVVLSSEKTEAYRIRKTFWFLPDQYAMTLTVEIENLAPSPKRFEYELTCPLYTGEMLEKEHSDLESNYFYQGQNEALHVNSFAKQPHVRDGLLDWAALEKKYFTLIVKPETEMERVRTVKESFGITDYLKPKVFEMAPGEKTVHRYFIYAGPKSYDVLKASQMEFEKILHTKHMGGFWIYFLIMLKFFYKIFHNYGIAIIVLSAAIKLLFTPLTHMSFDSMRRMQAVQPKMKALQEQYKKDPQKLNKEVMELYKKHKVNPLGGCFPMLLQMPIFIALYQTFSHAMELRGAPFFGWVKDLSEPDQFFLMPFSLPAIGNQINILPIIMIGTMLWQQKLTPQTAATKDQEMIMLFTPVIFGFVFYGLPSGLVIYWIINNLLTIGHQLLMKKFHPVQPIH